MKHFVLLVVLGYTVLTAGVDPAATLFRQPTAKEIERVMASIRKDARRPDSLIFVSASLKEPPKRQLLDDPSVLVREIEIAVRDPRARRLHLVSGNAATGAITEWMRVDGEHHSLIADDQVRAESIVRAHRGWNAGLKRRGIDSTTVSVTIWPSGIPKTSFNTRIVRCLAWVMTNGVNQFDRPIEGLICTVNLDQGRVIEFYDRDVAPIAQPSARPATVAKVVRATPPPSIQVSGNTVTWKQWTFDATLRDREGLVISRLRWTDGSQTRQVAHQLALSEIVMVNNDTSNYWYWRNALIIGEFGLGRTARALVPGVDVPAASRLLDAVMFGVDATLRTIKGAIAIHERDGKLVITQESAVHNYRYRTAFVLGPNGSITVDVGVGGTPFAKGVTDSLSREGLVAKNIVAPYVQHHVNVRCDLDVDGPDNIVSEIEYHAPLAEDDAYHNAAQMDDYELRFEAEAMRSEAPAVQRRWRVASSGPRSDIGQRPSYVLVPSQQQPSFLREPNMMLQRAPFLKSTFISTQWQAKERYASGEYPMQSSGDDDISEYVRDNALIYRKDVVLWYTMGLFTAPRAEDWPVMEMQHVSFSLIPDGFARSPQR